jgi:electron transport complex protein RnfG
MAETKDSTIMILVKLTLIAAVAAVVLTATYGATKDELERQAALMGGPDKQLLDMGVVPDAAKFKAVTVDDKVLYYEAYDSSGSHIGYGFIAEIMGAQDVMEIAGGMDPDLKMTGFTIIKQKDTPGYGEKIEVPEFNGSFVGVGPEGLALSSKGGQIDGISGATLSSTAVTVGVRELVEQIQQEVS